MFQKKVDRKEYLNCQPHFHKLPVMFSMDHVDSNHLNSLFPKGGNK